LTTGWTTGCIVYTNIQPVVNQVVQPLCAFNRFDNRLNVCFHDAIGCSTGCSTGLTTGYIV